MMKMVYLLLKVLVLLVLLFFTVQNTHVVKFVWGVQQSVEWPLIVLLLLFFVIGALFGIFAMLGRILQLRNEVNTLKRAQKKAEKSVAEAQRTPDALSVPATPTRDDSV